MKFFLLIILIFIVRCNTISERSVKGSWSYVNILDSTYSEIYFSEEFLVHNFSSIGIDGVYRYIILNDSLFIGNRQEFVFKIIDYQDDYLLVSNYAGNKLTLEKLGLPEENFMTFCIPDNRRIELQRGRIFRGTEALLKKGLMNQGSKNSDSVIYIPEFEK